ncbi:MAG TPA: hypothetical protein VFA52_03735 [Candidatus Paceibacterota bacterium]|nr:hypothetical protein [Candidatus Paceibacterota bacterium]
MEKVTRDFEVIVLKPLITFAGNQESIRRVRFDHKDLRRKGQYSKIKSAALAEVEEEVREILKCVDPTDSLTEEKLKEKGMQYYDITIIEHTSTIKIDLTEEEIPVHAPS